MSRVLFIGCRNAGPPTRKQIASRPVEDERLSWYSELAYSLGMIEAASDLFAQAGGECWSAPTRTFVDVPIKPEASNVIPLSGMRAVISN